jgi:CubicO group peptidase (beta-lactamase class C family)
MHRILPSILAIGTLVTVEPYAAPSTSTAPTSGIATQLSPTAELTQADLEAWLGHLVPPALAQGDIAGLVVSVVKDGKVLFEKGYGYADVAKKTPMDAERTVLKAASVSKTFTATAVMQLVEQGKLDLDRDVNEYLDFTIPAAFGKPITLRHLLTHTAGFEEISYKRYVPPITLRQHVLMVPDRIYPPGTVPAYSNYGLALAGYIVGRISGESITDYIERHILAPLGMQHSTFHVTPPPALEPLLAKNYAVASGEPTPPNAMVELQPADAPASALATTADDMTRFLLAHLQQGRYGDVQLLRPATVQLMHTPAFVPIPGAQPVALGLFRTDYRGHEILGHSGDGEGAHAEIRLLPHEGVGIFVAMNSDGAVNGIFPAAFTLRARLLKEFVDRYFPAPSAPQEPTAPTAKEHAQLVAGEYIWSRQQKGDFQEALALIGRFAIAPLIRANPDGTIETPAYLLFETSGRSQTWREVGPFVWREVGGDAHLVTNVRDGRVESLWSDQNASFWVDLPVPYLWSARLNVPLLGMAAGVLILTVLFWPVAAVVGRRRPLAVPLANRERRARRWTRVAALAGVLYLIGWAVALVKDFASTVGTEPWIRLFQLIGLGCVAGAGIAVWNVWLTWQGKRSGWAKATSPLVAASLLYLVWFSFAFHLISLRIN